MKHLNIWDRWFGGHIAFYVFGRRVTVYGYNAMHVAVNVWSRRWGWICFHPTWRMFGHWWPWYFYLSPNGTPGTATFAIGPGVSREEQRNARLRRLLLGHRYHVDDYNYDALLNIDYRLKHALGMYEPNAWEARAARMEQTPEEAT